MEEQMDLSSLIQDPLRFVEQCLASPALSSGAWNKAPHSRVAQSFQDFLLKNGSLKEIPVLNPSTWECDRDHLKNYTLVRFRAMVIDQPDPEFFVGIHRSTFNNNLVYMMYRDILDSIQGEEGESLEPCETMERRPLLLIPIPGEGDWATLKGPPPIMAKPDRGNASPSSSSSLTVGYQQRPKRALNEEGDWMDDDDHHDLTMNGAGKGRKCPRTENENENIEVAAVAMDAEENGNTVEASSSFQCLAYLYGAEESDPPPKLNEAIDVIGILSVLRDSTNDEMQAATATEEEADMMDHGASSVNNKQPRLHVLTWTRAGLLPTGKMTDFMMNLPSVNASVPTALQAEGCLPKIREEVLNRLTCGLGGDALAAEYLLLNLLSRIHLRTTGGDVVGHLPINFSRISDHVTESFGKKLGGMLSELVARCQLLDMNLDTLGDPKAWIPSKDYETNVLSTTPLQVTPGTIIVLDETGLESGRLTAAGVANVQCLKRLIGSMKTTCNFGFYELNFEADCPVVILSKSRSILGGALCEIPLTMQGGQVMSPLPQLSEETLGLIRLYMAQLAGYPVELDQIAAAQAEQEYVELRGREAGKGLTPEDLSRWITITRLLCASFGERKVRMEEYWLRMKRLETARTQRLRMLAGDTTPSQ